METKTLEEIFKDKPELLKEPSVTELIEYVSAQHHKMVKLINRQKDLNFKIATIAMNSEVMVFNGSDAKRALCDILEIV